MGPLIGGIVAVVFVGFLLLVALGLGAWMLFSRRKATPTASVKSIASTLIAPGAVSKLIDSATTGNVSALKDALLQEIEFEWANGGKQLILGMLVAAVKRRMADPNAKTPIVDAVAYFTGKTKQEIENAVIAEFLPNVSAPVIPVAVATPTPSPAVAVGATMLVLLCCSLCQAAYPVAGPEVGVGPSHYHATVHAPERFYPTAYNLIAEPKPASVAGTELPKQAAQFVYGPDGRAYQPAGQPRQQLTSYGNQPSGWYAGKIVGAPFRWFAHRRFRPFARLLGRC